MGKIRRTASLLWLLYRHPRTPAISKILPWAALAYLVFPLDLLPDPAPLLGMIDDLTILITFTMAALRFIPKDVHQEVKNRR